MQQILSNQKISYINIDKPIKTTLPISSYQFRSACMDGNVEIVKLYIKNGGDINVHDRIGLSFACERGHEEIVKLLVENGAIISTKQDNWPVFACFINNHPDLGMYLIKNGAKVSQELICKAGASRLLSFFAEKHLNVKDIINIYFENHINTVLSFLKDEKNSENKLVNVFLEYIHNHNLILEDEKIEIMLNEFQEKLLKNNNKSTPRQKIIL